MSNERTPDEILTLLDGAQEQLEDHNLEHGYDCPYDLRALLWEVLDAVVWIGRDTASGPSPTTGTGTPTGHEVMTSIEQFLANNFGDD